MISAIALLALSHQQLGPILPPSCSPIFQATVLSVEDALQRQDFERANNRLRLLPKTTVAVGWDDSKVPANYRVEFRKVRDEALDIWKKRVPALKFEFKQTSDIRFSFEPVLAIRPDTGLPASHVGFFTEEINQPRLDFVIGLKRGKPLQTTEVTDVFDDVAYAVGLYFGICDGPVDIYTMGTSDLPRATRTQISGTEITTLRSNMKAVAVLRKAVQERTQVIAAKSEVFIDPMVIQAPPSLQGDRVDMDIQVSNHGTGPLSYSLSPDCGCTIVTDPGTIDAQSMRLLKVAVDTHLFSTDMEKHVVVYTNDPSQPIKVVTLKIPIQPRYRLIAPDGDTVVVRKGGRKYPIYLIPARDGDLDPVSFKFDGMNASVTVQPFHGLLADPEKREGPKMRKGFKYTVNIKDDLPPGRAFGTLQILTANSEFPNITCTMYAQKGIIALPEEVYMGEVGKVPHTDYFNVSGPGTAFKVLGVEINTPHLKATTTLLPDASYRVAVTYDGLGKPGEMIAAIRVKTNDPNQPVIHVSVRAIMQ